MLTVTPLVKKLTAFYCTQRFITTFTAACHWSLFTTIWIQSTAS